MKELLIRDCILKKERRRELWVNKMLRGCEEQRLSIDDECDKINHQILEPPVYGGYASVGIRT